MTLKYPQNLTPISKHLDDLKTTAQTIAESYNLNLARENKDLFDALANTYHEYKETLKTQYTIKEKRK